MYETFNLSDTSRLAKLEFNEGERLFSPIFVAEFLDKVSVKITRKDLFNYLNGSLLSKDDLMRQRISFKGSPNLTAQEAFCAQENIAEFILILLNKVRDYYEASNGLYFPNFSNTLEAYLLLNCQIVPAQRSTI